MVLGSAARLKLANVEYFGDRDFRFGQKLNTLRAARIRRPSEPSGLDFCLTNAAWCGIL
jgi:hypothetical protein